jgi:hypothetical protein
MWSTINVYKQGTPLENQTRAHRNLIGRRVTAPPPAVNAGVFFLHLSKMSLFKLFLLFLNCVSWGVSVLYSTTTPLICSSIIRLTAANRMV